MFFQFQIFFGSLIFLGILESVSKDAIGGDGILSVGGLLFKSFLALVLLVYIYQIANRVSKRAIMTPMPIVFAFSTMGLLYFVQSAKQAHLLIVLAVIAYYFIHLALYRLRIYYKDKTARGIIAAGTLATTFLFYATSYGIYLNFAIPLWILMAALMLVSALLSFEYFWIINDDKKNVLNYSLVLGFVMAEIVWVLNFWPFGYLTTGVISLIFYYVFWDLVQGYFLNKLSKKRVIFNLVFFGTLVAIVLSSTRWLPVV